MTKAFRRHYWFLSGFFRKYHRVILSSLLFSIILGLITTRLFKALPKAKPLMLVGIIGSPAYNQIPPLVKQLLNSGLTSTTVNLSIVPNLADRWTVSDDGKLYTFYLKPDLTWTNSKPVKAEDISLNIPNVNFKTEDGAIVFTLPEKFAPFPSVLTLPLTDKNGRTASSYEVLLKQNSNGSLSQIILISKTRRIVFKFYPNPSQALTAFKLGQIDYLYNFPQLESTTNLNEYADLSPFVNYQQSLVLYFNHQDPLLKQKNLRQGIAYLLKDKEFGFTRSKGPISPLSWAFNPLVKNYDFDPQRAAKLLKESLPPDTKEINLELATNSLYLPLAQKIKEQLDSESLKINIKVVSSKPDGFQLYLDLLDNPLDPDQYTFWHSTHPGNIGRFTDVKLDKTLEDGRTTLDLSERKKIYAEFQRTFAEELPALFLLHPHYLTLSRKGYSFDIINLSQDP
ncbi:ABC transporter substrate-binding protein [Candidatus Collierbacteria bacterium]|nr:ABC transporter substrate-binding protein [Candidatus Collierbacteria bacterium]